jgi:hypothetical protein
LNPGQFQTIPGKEGCATNEEQEKARVYTKLSQHGKLLSLEIPRYLRRAIRTGIASRYFRRR